MKENTKVKILEITKNIKDEIRIKRKRDNFVDQLVIPYFKQLFQIMDTLEPKWRSFNYAYDLDDAEQRKELSEISREIYKDQFDTILSVTMKIAELFRSFWKDTDINKNKKIIHLIGHFDYTSIQLSRIRSQFLDIMNEIKDSIEDHNASDYRKKEAKDQIYITLSEMHIEFNAAFEHIEELKDLIGEMENFSLSLKENRFLPKSHDPELIKKKIKQQRLVDKVNDEFYDFFENLLDKNQKTPWENLEQKIPNWRTMKDESHRLFIQRTLKNICQEIIPFQDYLNELQKLLNEVDRKVLARPIKHESITLTGIRYIIFDAYLGYSTGVSMLENALEKLSRDEYFRKIGQKKSERKEIVEAIEESFHYFESTRNNLNKSIYELMGTYET